MNLTIENCGSTDLLVNDESYKNLLWERYFYNFDNDSVTTFRTNFDEKRYPTLRRKDLSDELRNLNLQEIKRVISYILLNCNQGMKEIDLWSSLENLLPQEEFKFDILAFGPYDSVEGEIITRVWYASFWIRKRNTWFFDRYDMDYCHIYTHGYFNLF